MDKKRILIVTQELKPYTALSEISEIARQLPEYLQENGMELRILMPRYGTINERRHRLHEVVRLSGMNIIVDDDDFPLIIKVASLPGTRMQVYFLDNEDFFKRKSVFENSKGKPFDDNADRMVFFCKGVLETVKKFGWPPDVIHCHGWMTSLLPLYLKTAYQNEPLFQQSKVIYSAYPSPYEENFKNDNFAEKASINNLNPEDISSYMDDSGVHLNEGVIQHADALIQGSGDLTDTLKKQMSETDKPVLEYPGEENYLESYLEFYNSLLEVSVQE